MRKVIFLAIFLLAGWQGPPPNKSASYGVQKEAKTNQASTPKPVAVTRGTSTEDDGNQSPGHAKQGEEESVKVVSAPKIETESKKDTWDKALVCATWVLVVIGALQIIFLWRTVNATKDNAKAALFNGQAVINSERAWMLLHKSLRPDRPHADWEFEVRVQNFGKTPARLLTLKIEHQIGGSEAPPDTTIFENSNPLIATLMPQGEYIEYPFSVREVLPKERYLWICGAIRYQDVLDRPENPIHETLFCRRFEGLEMPNARWIPGPDRYNTAT